MNLLKEWFDRRPFSIERHYRGSDHGFTWKGFSSKLAQKNDVLVVVESEAGKKFGGFTSIEIMKGNSKKSQWFKDPKAFVFSLSKKTKHSV